MAQSALECANRALNKLGAEPVTAIDGTTDTSKEAMFCYRNLDLVRKALLRDYPWNFAIKRKIITPPASFAVSNVTWVSSQLVEVTHATASYTTGQYVTLTGITGATLANGTFEIQSAVGATTTRITVPLATTSALLGTYESSDSDYIRLSPAYEFTQLYTLPSDCLRVVTINDEVVSDEWRIEGGKILSNEDTSIEIRYVQDVTDYTAMDVSFYECLAIYTAWEGCDYLTGDASKKRDLWTDLHGGDGKAGLLPKAKFIDVAEDSLQRVQGDDWVSARWSGAGVGERLNIESSAI